MLEVKGLHSGYGKVPILWDVGFVTRPGECVGILGRNGAGKTTLLRALVGELPTWSGTILKDGVALTTASTRLRARSGIGYVPQGKQIFATLTVAENLRMGCVKDFRRAEGVIAEVLDLFPRLTSLLERQGGSLSGGEQQLLALARCLCGRPDLILLDEPTEGIQPSICDEIVDVLQTLRKTSALTVIVVEQDIDFLNALCDRILLVEKGAIAGELDPKSEGSVAQAKRFIGFEEPAVGVL